MNTTEKGNLTELKIAVDLVAVGKLVLKPIGEGCSYDLLLDEACRFTRIQCKTGRLRNGAIIFNTVSQYGWKRERKSYDGRADLFGVYCHETDATYLVPVDKVGKSHGSLRVEHPKNNQFTGLMAKDFQILRPRSSVR